MAENLAHANTPGYRRRSFHFEAINPAEGSPTGATTETGYRGVRTSGEVTHFDSGPLQQTGNPLDLALSGDAFFALDGPDGPVYTRAGSFQLNQRGELQNKSGLRVRGQGGGAIVMPTTVNRVTVDLNGYVYADGAQVGQL